MRAAQERLSLLRDAIAALEPQVVVGEEAAQLVADHGVWLYEDPDLRRAHKNLVWAGDLFDLAERLIVETEQIMEHAETDREGR